MKLLFESIVMVDFFLVFKHEHEVKFPPFLWMNAATTLTSWHLMVTFCTLHAAQRLNFFETKAIDLKTVMLFGILNGISIGLLNLSLGFNSVGFYQVPIPCCLTIEAFTTENICTILVKYSNCLLIHF